MMNISLGLSVSEKRFVTKVHSRSATSGKRKHSLRAPPFPLPSLPLLSLTFYSSFDMVVLIKNNVASVEDVADSSLSPAGRVAQRCTPGCSPASSPSLVVQSSSNLADSPASLPSQAPSATSSTGHFSFHFDQYEEWTDEVEARMQNDIDRMLEDARRVLTEPVPNISELFPDDLLADSVAHQAAADSLASRFAAADEMIRELEAIAEDEVWEELGMLSPIAEESLADEFVVEEDAHSPPQSFKHAICFEERQWVADKVRITTSSGEPPIPPTPPDVYLRQRRRRWKPPGPSLIALRLTENQKKIRKLTKSIRGDHGVKH
ncbi:hypothetical protein L210DRAFT_3515393 [Boletus edulis BED1]|uniref:Uncharacterized protein n=1 Tax=Boletus edulis BED1 TaxID=1328754 RepID=A0AAD4GLM8_BOLED|nr:hypothetical protein L210DRAFT_3515393 [Boletus edulis BED1]